MKRIISLFLIMLLLLSGCGAPTEEGANIVITGRNVAKLEKAKEELESKYGVKVLALAADISAAKEGIRGLSRVAATEWAKDGINTNVICPLAWTAQPENFEKAYPEAFKANVKMPPAGHFGDSETEIGRVCVQLANPDFKYLNGETLTLEGGMGLRP